MSLASEIKAELMAIEEKKDMERYERIGKREEESQKILTVLEEEGVDLHFANGYRFVFEFEDKMVQLHEWLGEQLWPNKKER